MAWMIRECPARVFIASFRKPPRGLVLDFNANGDLAHGRQGERFFYGGYCFLPLACVLVDEIERRALCRTKLVRA